MDSADDMEPLDQTEDDDEPEETAEGESFILPLSSRCILYPA